MLPDPVDVSTQDSSPTPTALQWARVLQLIKTQGFNLTIVLLLLWNMGVLGALQSTGCSL